MRIPTYPLRSLLKSRPLHPHPATGTSLFSHPFSTDTPLDSFQILHIPRHFGIDTQTLRTTYRNLLKELHPDKHTLKPYPERQLLEEQASQVTQAYQLLQSPHSRATHLLELEGWALEEGSNDGIVGMEFLMEILELREAIEAGNDLVGLREQSQERTERVMEELEEAFNARDFERARKLAAQLQYWHRIERSIHERLDE